MVVTGGVVFFVSENQTPLESGLPENDTFLILYCAEFKTEGAMEVPDELMETLEAPTM